LRDLCDDEFSYLISFLFLIEKSSPGARAIPSSKLIDALNIYATELDVYFKSSNMVFNLVREMGSVEQLLPYFK